jgi:hypothetical protein
VGESQGEYAAPSRLQVNDAVSLALSRNSAESGSGNSSDTLVFGGASIDRLDASGPACDGLSESGGVSVLGEPVASPGSVLGDEGSSLDGEGDRGCPDSDASGRGVPPSSGVGVCGLRCGLSPSREPVSTANSLCSVDDPPITDPRAT